MGTLKPRTSVVPVYQGDDADKIADLRADAERAALTRRGNSRLDDGDADPFAAAVESYNVFLDEAYERALKVTIAALRKDDWRDLIADHPPRADVLDDDGKVVKSFDADHEVGFNVQTVAEPLISATLDRVEELGLDQELERDDADELSDADFNRIYSAAVDLNIGSGPDPKARLSLPPVPTSSGTSESPARSD